MFKKQRKTVFFAPISLKLLKNIEFSLLFSVSWRLAWARPRPEPRPGPWPQQHIQNQSKVMKSVGILKFSAKKARKPSVFLCFQDAVLDQKSSQCHLRTIRKSGQHNLRSEISYNFPSASFSGCGQVPRSGAIWVDRGGGNLARSGLIWADLGRSGAIWADLGRSGSIWGDLERSGAVCAICCDPGRSGSI